MAQATEVSGVPLPEGTWVVWDGAGALVPPGLYVVEVEVEGDAGDRSRRRMVPVAY